MTTDEDYQAAVSGIALARETVRQVSQAIRDGMDAGDDPVIILHNMAGTLSKEAPFQTGGHGAAVFVVACFLLADSGFFEPRVPYCVGRCAEMPGLVTNHDPRCSEYVEPVAYCEDPEYLNTCPVHRVSWAETLDILADPELAAQLTESIEDHVAIEAASSLDAMVAEEFESWEKERNEGL